MQDDYTLMPSVERFYISDKTVEQDVLKTKRYDVNTLFNQIKPGDVVITYPKLQDISSKLSYKLNTFVQRMAFSSIKYIGLNKKVIGYGVAGGVGIQELDFKTFANNSRGILILRHKQMTSAKAKKIYTWISDKLKKAIPYDRIGILKAILHRILGVMGTTLDAKKIDQHVRSLYCSTIIHLAFKVEQLQTGIASIGDLDVFPKDFLYSNMFTKIGLYLDKEELEPSTEEYIYPALSEELTEQLIRDLANNIEVSEHFERDDVARYLYGVYCTRTNQHRVLVQQCGMLLIPVLKDRGLDIDEYMELLENHDNDKFDVKNLAAKILGTQYHFNKSINKYFKPRQEILDTYDNEVWPDHIKNNPHHVGEHYGKLVDKTWVVDEDEHYLDICVMYADWMAMGIELGNSASDWWNKCKGDRKYRFQERDYELLEELKMFEIATLDHASVLRDEIILTPLYGEHLSREVLIDEKLRSTKLVGDQSNIGCLFYHFVKEGETLTKKDIRITVLGKRIRHSNNPNCKIDVSTTKTSQGIHTSYSLMTMDYIKEDDEFTVDFDEAARHHPKIDEFIKDIRKTDIALEELSISTESQDHKPAESPPIVEGALKDEIFIDEKLNAAVTRSTIEKKEDDLPFGTWLGVALKYDIPVKDTLTKDDIKYTELGRYLIHSDTPNCRLKETMIRSIGRNCREYPIDLLQDLEPDTPITIDFNKMKKKYPHLTEFIPYAQLTGSTETASISTEELKPDQRIKSIVEKVRSTTHMDIGLEALKPSTEAAPKSSAKKQAIINYICKYCDIMDPSKLNSNRYKKMLSNMSDKQFHDFMVNLRDNRFQLHLVAPNMKINLTVKNMIKAADTMGLKLFHRVWMRDRATGRRFLSDNEYLVVQLPVRRQEQFIDKKMSVPDNDRTIDGLTGQVSWDSAACSITNPEIQILASRNMDASLYELVNVRGGNINSYAEMKRSLEENGEARLNDLDPSSRTRVAVMGGVLLTAMLLDSNL